MMEIKLELSDPEVIKQKHTMSCIFHKILATGRPVAKTLIKYNKNNSEENDEKEKELMDIEFTDQNADPEIMKMLSTLMISVKEEDE